MRDDMRLLRHLRAYAGDALNDVFYFYSAYGGLLRMDLKDGQMEYLNSPSIFSESTDSLCFFLVRNCDKIYQMNSHSGEIVGFDHNVHCSLKEMGEVDSAPLFVQSFGPYIYCLLNNGMLFTDIDVGTGEYTFVDWRKIFSKKSETYPISYGGLHGDKIFAFSWDRRDVVIYEMKQAEQKRYHFPEDIGMCKHIAPKDNGIFVLNENNQIYYWEPQNGHANKIWDEVHFSTEEIKKDSCGRIHLCGNKLVILPSRNGEDIRILDVASGVTDTYRDYPDDFQYMMGDPYKFVRYVETETEIIYPMRSANYVLKIDRRTGKLYWVRPRLPKEEDILAHFRPNKSNVYEEMFPLKSYPMLVKGNGMHCLRMETGEKIWNFLK